MYGPKGRIGLIVPSTNTVMEMEFHKMLPEGVSFYTSRVKSEHDLGGYKVSVERLMRHLDNLEEPVRLVCDVNPNIVLYGCTSGSMMGGSQREKEIISKMEKWSNCKSLTTGGTVLEAMNEMKVNKLSIVTPYIDAINQKQQAFFEQNGFEVISINGLGNNLPKGASSLAPESLFGLAKRFNDSESDCLFISCTDLRTIEIIEPLESDLQKTVITSNQASMWACLKKINFKGRISGYGKLFHTL